MDYLLAIEKALTILCDTKKLNMETLRVTSICGANTLAHTDSCRGVTPNWLMFHGEGGELTVKIFPSFRCSVVNLRGKLYIPAGYSSSSGLRMYGLDKNKAYKYEFPPSDLQSLIPFGDLPYAVIGLKKGKMQIINLNNFSTIPSSKDLKLVTFLEAVDACSQNPKDKFVRTERTKKLREPHKFHQFHAWKHIHYYTGSPHVPRTHAHLRPLRTDPTGSYYKRKNTPNFFTITEEDKLLEKEELKEEFNKVVM
jgi:hypothetical protein